jgi:hypothetical protein
MHHDPNALLLTWTRGLPLTPLTSGAGETPAGEPPLLRGWLRRSRRDRFDPSEGGRR